MNIGLLAVDSNYPNLSLMKISSYHKGKGDIVEWYNPFDKYDIVYMSKIFSFTPDYGQYMTNTTQICKGGTGYDVYSTLPEEIDLIKPDYSIYPSIGHKTAYGFLTRGCPNKCKWCIVPKKEGVIKPYMDVEEIAIDGRNELILMDNNILASDHGIEQIEKIIKMNESRKKKIKVDFNQGLDARLVTDEIAKMLSRLKWIQQIRFGCDTPKQIEECEKACAMIDKHGYKGEYFFYCILLDDFDESFSRVNHWKKKGSSRYLPHCQPFRDIGNKSQIIPQWQKDMARWTDRKHLFRSCEFEDFEPRKGFKCKEYFL